MFGLAGHTDDEISRPQQQAATWCGPPGGEHETEAVEPVDIRRAMQRSDTEHLSNFGVGAGGLPLSVELSLGSSPSTAGMMSTDGESKSWQQRYDAAVAGAPKTDELDAASWAGRLQRGERWHRYWNHPRRWTRGRWALFWTSTVLHTGLAVTVGTFAFSASGWASVAVYASSGVFAFVAIGGLVAVSLALRQDDR